MACSQTRLLRLVMLSRRRCCHVALQKSSVESAKKGNPCVHHLYMFTSTWSINFENVQRFQGCQAVCSTMDILA